MNKINTSSLNSTPQTQALTSDQVVNPAGGYIWQVDDMTQLRRFLMLGVEGGTYYAKENDLTRDNAKSVIRLANTKGEGLVKEIVNVSVTGRSAKQDPLLFSLAIAAVSENPHTRKLAREAVAVVCRTASHLFTFVDYYKKLGGGWGRAMRDTISSWYNTKDANNLVYQMTKYKQRGGWSHRDLLRLAHIRPVTSDHNKVFRYAVKGDLDFDMNDVMNQEAFARLEAIHKAKTVTDENVMVRLIEDFNLVREHVPTRLLKSVKVQEALLNKMPMTALIRNLGGMTASGLLAPMNAATNEVLSKLNDVEALKKARIHPFNVLVALNTYKQGHGLRGSSNWKPVSQIVDALDGAFYNSFHNVEPTNQRFMLGVDVSGSMGWGAVNGSPSITPMVAAAAMALTTAKTEKNYCIHGFSHQFVDLDISPKMRLDHVVKQMNKTTMGGTDCSLPIVYALKNKILVDTFIVYTDNETYYGKQHPSEALKKYRDKMGIPSRLITCAFTGGFSTIADPNDSGMLDLAGFDSGAPGVIREFSLGNI